MSLAIIVSKRFNPGHLSHIEANAKLFEDYGFDVRFSVHGRYLTFSEGLFKSHKANVSNYLNLRAGDFFVIWFPSISVLFNSLFVSLTSSATIVYVYHEPYTSFASYREAGFSRMKALKVTAISLVNWIICSLSHKIILPSARAYNALPAARINTDRYAKINLLFSDEARPDQLKTPRTYISYIGTIAEDHAFEEFVRLMHASICNKTLAPFKFLIATRSQIPEKLSAVIEQGVLLDRLVVQSGAPMTNEQINDFYAQSYVVWNAYKRSMQSGVLPKAYMFGTPVLVSTSNQSEYFVEGVHGALISDQYSDAEFEGAILKMQPMWPALSENCRDFFLQNFDYRSLASTFMNFISDKK
jgi:glycosyltransferase involved in cell wall biosynthesis